LGSRQPALMRHQLKVGVLSTLVLLGSRKLSLQTSSEVKWEQLTAARKDRPVQPDKEISSAGVLFHEFARDVGDRGQRLHEQLRHHREQG